jgi:hypothetical protein
MCAGPHFIHALANDIEVLKSERSKYGHGPDELIAASHVIAAAFATIAAANNYWR